MKRRIIIIIAIFITTALLFLAGQGILSALHPDNLPPRPIDNAAELYQESIAEISSAQDIVMSVRKEQKTTIDSETLLEITEQTIIFSGLNSEGTCVSVDETLTIDTFQAKFNERYINGTGYVTINGNNFSCAVEQQEYLSAFPSAVLLNAQLYSSISGTKEGGSYTIAFSGPTAIEDWVTIKDVILESAHGTAYIDKDARLTKSFYTYTYTRDKANIEVSYTTEVKAESQEIAEPENKEQYTPINYLNALRTLERASGYLLQAKNVTSKYHDSIYFQAFGDTRTQDIILHTAQSDNWASLVTTKTHLINESRGEQSTTLDKTELFINEQYSQKAGDSESTVNTDIKQENMRGYCQNILVGNIMLPQYIIGADLSEMEDRIRITFTANEEFANMVSANACNTLYQNPNLLSDLEKPGVTKKMQCYLDLDPQLLLPIASAIEYVGSYTVEGVSYTVFHKTEQTYDIPSQNALEEIKKAAE